MNIYFDNAATSFPKPKEVTSSITNYMTFIGGSAGRGSSSSSLQNSRLVYECRNTISNFFNYDHSENVIFTNNITSSINILLMSILKNNWHIITTSMEHNSVIRPLVKLQKELNLDIDIIQASKEGFVNIKDIQSKIKPETKLIILSHASNLVGSIQPIKEIGILCKKNNIFFILDSAQSAGVIPIDMKECNINALAFTGHKSLFGPQGIGGFIIDEDLNEIASNVFVGGTGSSSYSLEAPIELPDKFECGTLNIPGIIGLLEGIKFINKEGILNIKEKEEDLCKIAIDNLSNMDFVTLYGSKNTHDRTSAISFNINGLDASEVGYILDNEFGIITRTGLHCTPLAHKTVGSFPNGSVRISLGYFNDRNEVSYFIDSLNKIKNNIL